MYFNGFLLALKLLSQTLFKVLKSFSFLEGLLLFFVAKVIKLYQLVCFSMFKQREHFFPHEIRSIKHIAGTEFVYTRLVRQWHIGKKNRRTLSLGGSVY